MPRPLAQILLLSALAAAVTAARAELVEEIVAWVNGEIITLSEFEKEDEAQTAEAYRRFAGEELDAWVKQSKPRILLDMIDRKILVHHAKALGYDLDRLGDSILESFREAQNLESDKDFEHMIAEEGMTVDEIKRRLVEMYAPQEVINFEVRNRLAISDAEVEGYYREHQDQLLEHGAVSFREIVLLADSTARRDERRAEAQAIQDRLAAGEDFGALAREVSEAGTRAEGGLIGPLGRDDLSAQLAEVAFSIPVGSVSAPLEAPYGFHLLKVESRTDDRTPPLDEVRDRLRELLERRAMEEKMDQFMTRMRDDSEWCVKPKYQHLVPIPAPTECQML
jgi:peptidyl-prolyl cis-trans isomerase SurA